MRSCAIGAKSSRGARYSNCARRANAATYLEGLAIALANIDEIIAADQGVAVARGGEGRPDRREPGARARCRKCWRAPARSARGRKARPAALGLVDGGYRLTDIQAQAILDMRLNRLTGLEQDKIIAEFQELLVHDPRS